MIAPRFTNWQASTGSFLVSLACLLALLFASPAALSQQYTWHDVPRLVAISDPHGAYDAMVRTLVNAGIDMNTTTRLHILTIIAPPLFLFCGTTASAQYADGLDTDQEQRRVPRSADHRRDS